MCKELEKKLVERWPDWFDVHGDPRETAMVRGFEHGDGWFDLVWKLCEELEPLVRDAQHRTTQQFKVLQVKEKFGGLRFYVNTRDKRIAKEIEAAEEESFRDCEICGKPGTRRLLGRRFQTRCEDHFDC